MRPGTGAAFGRLLMRSCVVAGVFCASMSVYGQNDAGALSAQGAVTQSQPESESKPAVRPKATGATVKKKSAKAQQQDRRASKSRADRARTSQAASDAKPAVVESPPAVVEPAEASAQARPALVVDGAAVPAHEAQRGPEIEVRVSASQQRENAYRSAVNLLSEGRVAEAGAQLQRILAEHPAHDNARQALIGIALKSRQFAQAETLADDRLVQGTEHLGFAVVSARLKLDRADPAAAVDVLKRSEIHARSNPEYQALMAAVLQRLSRHAEAADRFRAALALQPGTGVWLMGLGVSLQALERSAEAVEAFKRARDTAALTPELRAFVDERVAELQR